ncbi:hypothetical protein PanWU01x14_187770, partial [Parasponia andersonii]
LADCSAILKSHLVGIEFVEVFAPCEKDPPEFDFH